MWKRKMESSLYIGTSSEELPSGLSKLPQLNGTLSMSIALTYVRIAHTIPSLFLFFAFLLFGLGIFRIFKGLGIELWLIESF